MNLKEKLILGGYIGGALTGSILSKVLESPYKDFIHNYGHDVTYPIFIFFWSKLVFSYTKINKKRLFNFFNTTYTFLGCSAFEIAQGLGLQQGTFDTKDFLAYAAGTGLAFTLDKLTFKKESIETLVEDIEIV